MIFNGTTKEDNYAKAYLLASLGVGFVSDVAYFDSGAVYGGNARSGDFYVFCSVGYWHASELAVRSIVSLKSEVTVKNIEKCDGVEKEWTCKAPSMSPLESGYIQEGQIVANLAVRRIISSKH